MVGYNDEALDFMLDKLKEDDEKADFRNPCLRNNATLNISNPIKAHQ